MKKALVIAGGQWQVPLINYLHSNGYTVDVVDPYTTSAGVQKADFHIQLDVRNKELIWQKLGKDACYEIVATDQSDVSVDTVAYIAERLGLPGNKEDVVKKYSNKVLSREFAQSIDVPVPFFIAVTSVDEVESFLLRHPTQLIIKPCDAQSSKGIHVIDRSMSHIKIEQCLKDALSYSFAGIAILEEFIHGEEITVEGFCANGKHQVLAISHKQHFKTGIASTLTYPSHLPKSLEHSIIEADNKYVELSGLSFGPTHAEYMVDVQSGRFWLIEIACRGGGTLISSDIVKWVSGFDVYEAYLKCLQGKETEIDMHSFKPLRRSAELHFFDFGSGIIKSIIGFDYIRKSEGIIAMDFPYKEGDIIESCKDDRSRQGFAIIKADNNHDLQARIDILKSRFHVIVR